MTALWIVTTYTFVALVLGTVAFGTLRMFGIGRTS
jgi:hypothetical protein